MKRTMRVIRSFLSAFLCVAVVTTSFDVSVFAKDNSYSLGNSVNGSGVSISNDFLNNAFIEYGQAVSRAPSDVVVFNEISEKDIDDDLLEEVNAYKEAFANGISLEDFVLNKEASEEAAEIGTESTDDEYELDEYEIVSEQSVDIDETAIEDIIEIPDDEEDISEENIEGSSDDYIPYDNSLLGHATLSLNAVKYIYATKTVDVKNNTHSIEHSHKPFRLVCDPGQSKEFISKYILYYDGKKLAESTNGEFTNINPKDLEIGKKFEIEAIGENNTSCKTTLLLTIDEDSLFNPQRVYLGGDEGFSLTLNKDIPAVGGKTIKLGFPDLPVSIALEDNTVKVGVNIAEKCLYDSDDNADKSWNVPVKPSNIKKVFANYSEDVRKGSFLKNMSSYNFMQNRNLGASVPMVEKNITFSVAGYIEGAYCSDSISKLSGQIVIGIAGKLSSTTQKFIPVASLVIPVVITFDASLNGTLIGEISYDFDNSEITGFIGAGVVVSVSLFGGIGAGRWFSVGLYGMVSLATDFNIISNDPKRPSGCTGVYLYGEAGVQAWIIRKQYKISIVTTGDLRKKYPDKIDDKGRLILYKRPDVNAGGAAGLAPVDDFESLEDDEQLFMISDFETMPSLASSLNGGFAGTGLLVEDAYQGAAPQMVSAGGTTIIMFTDSDVSRPELDQSVVKYVIYDDIAGTISPAYQLDEDSTVDSSPILYTDGNDIYCAYLNSVKSFDSDAAMEEYTGMFDVCVSRYDADVNKFVSLGTVNSNTGMCYSPSLQFTPQGMVAMWVENDNKTFLGLDNSNVIKTALYTGNGWLEENVVASDLNHIIDVDVAESGEVAWVVDLDNDLETQNHALYSSSGKRVYGNISDISFEKLPGAVSESLVYSADGGLYVCTGNTTETILDEGTMDPSGGFSFYKDDLYFVKTGENVRNLMRAVKSNKDKKWYIGDTTGFVAGDTPDYSYIDSFSVCNDKIVSLVSKSTPVKDDSGDVSDIEVTSQIQVFNDERCDLELNDVQFEDDDIFADSAIPVLLTVTNEGSKVEKGFTVKAGEFSEYVDCTIMPGETIDVQEYITSPSIITGSTDIDVEIICNDRVNAEEDCALPFDINVSDIVISLAYGADQKVHALICNGGSVDGTFDYILTDYKGNLLDSKSGVNLEAYDSIEYETAVTTDMATGVIGTILINGEEADTDYCEIEDITAISDVVRVADGVENLRLYSSSENPYASYMIEGNGDAIISTDEPSSRMLGEVFSAEHRDAVKTATFCDDITAIESVSAIINLDNLKKVVIANEDCTIAEGAMPSGVVICGYYGSTAYDYAVNHSMEFEAIDELYHNHLWGAGVDEILPTESSTGKRVYTCQYCKEHFVRELSPKGIARAEADSDDSGIVIEITDEGDSFEYTGAAITPENAVYERGYRLHKGTDYTVRYTNNIKVGTATATIIGKGNYSINDKISYKIIERDISKSDSGISVSAPDMRYTGREAKSRPVVSMNGKALTINTDYKLQYVGDITSLGIATVKVIGNGNYTGEITATYRIYNSSTDINSVYIEDTGSYTYTGEVIKPVFKIKASRSSADYLTEGVDYNIECSSIAAGNAVAYIKGIGATYGSYGGSKKVSFKINPKNIAGAIVSVDDSAIYNGKAQKPGITVKDEASGEVIPADCYSITYSNNITAAKSTDQKAPVIKITGKKNYKGNKTVNFTINPVSVYGEQLSVVINPVKDSGREITAKQITTTVKLSKKSLTRDRDYTVNFTRESGKSLQTAKLIFKGNYAGTVAATFRIYSAKEMAQNFDVAISDKSAEYYYSGEKITPKVVVSNNIDGNKVTLKEGVDYRVAYSNNVNACDKTAKNAPTIKVTGMGMYSGAAVPVTFTIKPMPLTAANVEVTVKDIQVNRNPALIPLKPAVTVINKSTGKKISVLGYKVEYLNNTAVTDTAIVRVMAKSGNYEGSIDTNFRIYEKGISSAVIDKIADMAYTRNQIRPRGSAVKLYTDRKKTTQLIEGVDYTLTYGENINIGKGTVTITGKGIYGGSKTVTFKIVPRTVK